MQPLNPWSVPERSFAGRDAWVAGRAASIGASESAGIIGVGYSSQSQVSIWMDKVQPAAKDKFSKDMLKRMEVSTILEPSLRKIFTLETGLDCWAPKPDTMMVHPDYDWITATLDGITEDPADGYCPVELKNVSQYNHCDWDDGQVPLKFQVQLQHQMLVTGAKKGYLLGLIGGMDPQVYPVPRNDEFIDQLVLTLKHFWSYVVSNTMPPVDGSKATSDALNAARVLDPQTVINLPAEAVLWHKEREAAKETEKKAKELAEEMSNRIRAVMVDATIGNLPDGTSYTYKFQDRSGYVVEPCRMRILRVQKAKKAK